MKQRNNANTVDWFYSGSLFYSIK